MNKVKKISKYIVNTLNIINALLLGINSVEGITIPYTTQISGVILVVCGVISTYLLGNKALGKPEIEAVQNAFNQDSLEELFEKGDVENVAYNTNNKTKK